MIATWSSGQRGHAPITIATDVKPDLTKAKSFAQGNPAALNEVLRDAFGDRLLTAEELGTADWPDVDDMRGRVLWVLSGDGGTRRG